MTLLLEAAEGVGELEGPQEVVGLLEVGADGPQLVDEVLNAGDAELAELVVNHRVVLERNALAVDLAVATGVDKLADGLAAGETVGDEGVDAADHVPGGLVELDEHTVVDLAEAEELHDLLLLGGQLVDTADTDHEGELGLTLNEEVAGSAGVTSGLHKCLIGSGVLSGVLLGVRGSLGTLGGTLLLGGLTGSLVGSELLGSAGGLLDDVLGDNSCPTKHSEVLVSFFGGRYSLPGERVSATAEG